MRPESAPHAPLVDTVREVEAAEEELVDELTIEDEDWTVVVETTDDEEATENEEEDDATTLLEAVKEVDDATEEDEEDEPQLPNPLWHPSPQ